MGTWHYAGIVRDNITSFKTTSSTNESLREGELLHAFIVNCDTAYNEEESTKHAFPALGG
jgi:hypothetical protein